MKTHYCRDCGHTVCDGCGRALDLDGHKDDCPELEGSMLPAIVLEELARPIPWEREAVEALNARLLRLARGS